MKVSLVLGLDLTACSCATQLLGIAISSGGVRIAPIRGGDLSGVGCKCSTKLRGMSAVHRFDPFLTGLCHVF